MSYPRLLRTLLTALPAALFLCPVLAAERRPNVILILADDLGFRDLGSYGHPSLRTPVLDKLAADGIRLTGFHSGATVCTPSRMSLLTGAYPVRLGWTQGVVGYRMGIKDGMNPDALTIAEIFRAADYATAISGKWHIGSLPDCRPHRQGFESTYYIPLSNNQTDEIWRDDEVVGKPFDNRRLTEQFTTEAVRFIRKNHDRPFFLYLPYTAPHFPVEPHPEWKGRSGFGNYGDVVEEMDQRIGMLLDTLAELGIDKRTIVVFTSDNGPQTGEQSSALPLRGAKWSPLEGGTRVPCIIRWPGTIPAGLESDTLISAMDLLPTLSHACGIDWKNLSREQPKIDGLNLWDALLGKEGAATRTDLLHWHGMDSEPQAIRAGDWKLFFNRRNALENSGHAGKARPGHQAPADDSSPILFNLRNDPGETVDLSAEFPDKVKALRSRADELTAGIKNSKALPLSTPEDPTNP
jgi:arylsulfatase